MRYDVPNPYAGMRIDVLYGYGRLKIQTNPHGILQHWAQRELETELPWLINELRLQATEIARADDDGMRQANGSREP